MYTRMYITIHHLLDASFMPVPATISLAEGSAGRRFLLLSDAVGLSELRG
jgi:hypothetical protein